MHCPKFAGQKAISPSSNFRKPPKTWWRDILPHCELPLAAAILFFRLHGRRTNEGLSITPADIDVDTWHVYIRDTKTGQHIVFRLADTVIEALSTYDWQSLPRVFGFNSDDTFTHHVKRACKRAGIPYHVPKDFGRHSFASALLEEGRTLKEVQEAGRWKRIHMPARIYGHLERSKVDEDARSVGDGWARSFLGK